MIIIRLEITFKLQNINNLSQKELKDPIHHDLVLCDVCKNLFTRGSSKTIKNICIFILLLFTCPENHKYYQNISHYIAII